MVSVSNPSPDLLALNGEIDLHESPQVRESLNPMIVGKLPRIFVDLSGVTYIDSSGIAVFIEAMQRMQAYGGKLALLGIRDSVKNIFEIARLDQVFALFPDKESAVKAG